MIQQEDGSLFQDYNVRPYSINSAKKYIKMLYELYKNNINNNNTTSPILLFSTVDYSFNNNYLSHYSSRFGIKIIDGFSTISSDPIKFTFLNPKEKAKKLQKELLREKRMWLSIIFESLSEISRSIDVNAMLYMIHKTIEEIEIVDICRELTQEYYSYEDCQTVENAFNNYLKNIIKNVPQNKFSAIDILNKCDNENIFITDPNINCLEILKNSSIKGIIVRSNKGLINDLQNLDLIILHGSGKWI